MTQATLAISFGMLLCVPGCSHHDRADTGTENAPTARRVAIASAFAALAGSATGLAQAGALTAESMPSTPRGRTVADRGTSSAGLRDGHAAILGIYAIDLPATTREAGLLGGLVAAKVRDAALELRADGTYAGLKHGQPQSSGRWSLEDGGLRLEQTHEKGEPTPSVGTGTIRDGMLMVRTERHGLSVTLVFRRR